MLNRKVAGDIAFSGAQSTPVPLYISIAQLEVQANTNRQVVGSSPTRDAMGVCESLVKSASLLKSAG